MNARTSVSTAISTIALAIATAGTPAWGQAIYRCGSSYGPQPCEGGRPLSAADERTPEQRAQADTATRRTAELADSMEESRLLDEALVEDYAPPAAARPKSNPNAKTERRPRSRGPEIFTARAPGDSGKRPAARKPRTAKATAR